jgi:signal transduction histidine kinase
LQRLLFYELRRSIARQLVRARRGGFRVTETARPSVSGAELPSDSEEGAAPSLLRLLLNWRDWNIPAKLAAVTLVPAVFAMVLGAMQIGDQVDRANSYRRVDRLVVLDEQVRPLVNALQRERTATTGGLAAGQPDLAGRLADPQRDTSMARDAVLRAARRATFQNEITTTRYAEVGNRLDELTRLREALTAGKLDAPGALAGYTVIIGGLLNFERATAAELIDPELTSTAIAVHDLEVAQEEIRYQQALVGIGLARGGLADDQLGALRASQSRLTDLVAEFQLDASSTQRQDFVNRVAGIGVQAREQLAGVALGAAPGRPLAVDLTAWNTASEDTAARTGAVAAALASLIRERSTVLQDQASDGAGLASVILLIALVVAAAVMLIIGRHLLRSLNVLRHSALDVAEHGLPDAVARIRDGGGRPEPAVEPVPVHSADEVGQVARAFDAVHRQALRLATEQAGLRARYGDVFVNLSRRSQGLVQRQLQLLERLERDEEDPEQLATLFQLDHLATRMRRNNENLRVLSGSELGRRHQRPATLSDLLRASVSEIEQYQRVVLLPAPDVLVVGYAVGDLVRLVAELLDNATAFSAPGTQVTIAGHSFADGSVCVAILDEGIGMSESELAAANAKLADAQTVDVSTSRRMGLFVVGRLAGRHRVQVSLHGGNNIPGVRASVTLPAELVTELVAEKGSTASSVTSPSPSPESVNGHGPVNGMVPSPLPRRAKPVNGVSTPDITQRLLGEDAEPEKETQSQGTVTAPSHNQPDNRTASWNATTAVNSGEAVPLPLPRRSPGSSEFVRPVDTEAGPVDLGAPMSPAEGLFQPGEAGWWDGDRRSSIEETTPIFDEMVSAWFRSITAEAPEGNWEFAADAGFVAAQAVSESQPDTFTDSGLPRRNPKQNLLPGSAGATAVPPPAERDPAEVRERLGEYQRGVSRARDERLVGDDAGADAGPPTLDLTGVGWRVSAAGPELTAGGLPRRTPRGPTQPVGGDGGDLHPDRAVELRGRLGNFQRGLTRGRRSLAELADRASSLGDEIAANPPHEQQESE